MITTAIGALIRQSRLVAGLEVAELAEAAEVAPEALGAWERGEAEPSLRMARRVLRECDVQLVLGAAPIDTEDPAPPAPPTDERACEWCGTIFARRRTGDGHLERSSKWRTRRYCSRGCANEANAGARWRVES